jgi:predicted extracellular nuclease
MKVWSDKFLRRAAVLTILAIAAFGRTSVYAQKEYSIAEIQGDKNTSSHLKEPVRVSGIVTARIRSGFFIQTPDDKTDNNPNTSEGVFVFTKDDPPADAAVGNLVTITGTVEEFRARNDGEGLTVTEISFYSDKNSLAVVSRENALPKAVVLTTEDLKLNTLDQLEKYEGMRVAVAEFIVVAPTGGRVDPKTATATSDGTFYGVVKGIARPFREPGLDITNVIFLPSKEKEKLRSDYPKMSFFDANPERIRVESTAQVASDVTDIGKGGQDKKFTLVTRGFDTPVDIPANTELRNLAGVLHYVRGTYTILTDLGTKPSIVNSVPQVVMPPPKEDEFTVAGMNLENFFDDEDDPSKKEDLVTTEAFNNRLKKISTAIREVMQSPDVIGTVEVENISALKRLAAKINADTVAAGKPDPRYEAYLDEGNDARGIDSGFLVKLSRVKVLETKQFGKNEKFPNASGGDDLFLNDRPPLMLRASIADPRTGQPFEFTAIVNHLKSLLGYDDPKRRDNVRMKKKLQAEFLARFVQERQKANPAEHIMLLGDFNAFQFNDGVMDVIGTIKGKPAGKDEVMVASSDTVDPDMTDLVDLIKSDQRYSFVYDGNAQVLDHFLVTENLRKQVAGFGYARVNADFPESDRGDASRAERYSDHDPAVAYFRFPELAARQ